MGTLTQLGGLPDYSHPQPLLRREEWAPLDGEWEYAIDYEGRWRYRSDVEWQGAIIVPFAPQTKRSGVDDNGLFKAIWYRRVVHVEPPSAGQCLFLHFGAVDFKATVWIDGLPYATHEGGYTPFTIDITPHAQNGNFEILVLAEDDPTDLSKPRGKQDWRLNPHSIWYPRTSGIWQRVWIERVPSAHIRSLRWVTSLERWEIACIASIESPSQMDMRLSVRLTAHGEVLADDVFVVLHNEVHRRIVLSDPGIDDSRNELLWSPASPTIIEAELELRGPEGQLLDRVHSYTALRSVGVQGDRFILNGRPFPLRLVLDQGYWPDTGLTPPDDEAIRRDVELAKAMGFNGVRKHQKVEDPRYLYWADRLGLLVWEEMPSAYRFTQLSVTRLSREWLDVVMRDYSHPCIVAWVPFNESWGVPNLPDSEAERHWIQALYHLTHTLDPDRLVIGNDGWESAVTDIIGIHDYDPVPSRMAARYKSEDTRPRLLKRERPGGRLLVLPGHESDPEHEHPIVLSEFGGIALGQRCEDSTEADWGYAYCDSPKKMARQYAELLRVVRSLDMLAGFCYTQFTDVCQEVNGLLYADRTPKFPIEQIAEATSGGPRHSLAEPMLYEGETDMPESEKAP